MCGIYGVISKKNQLSEQVVGRINSVFQANMGHRGPDSNGTFLTHNKKVLLGHLRLSIIDLENGIQPMTGNNGNVVVFNGEIYNFKVLKESLNYKFKTSSDTEVILAQYEEEANFCNRLNGMYGFALLDEASNILNIAVDPLGVKSLYIFENEELLVFSSELVGVAKCVSEVFDIEHKLDLDNCSSYLYHGMFLNKNTPLVGIKKLLPGSLIRLSLDDFSKDVSRIEFQSGYKSDTPLDKVLDDAVERQLIADVPICLFLSGGIDSSILAASLAKKGIDIKCFTFGFTQSDIDESLHAKLLAQNLGLECDIVKINDSFLQNAFLTAVEDMDEPITDFASIPLLELSKEASKEFKVCLLGDGGDELFYGYTHHKYWRYKLWMNNPLIKFLRFPKLMESFSWYFENSKNTILKRLALFAKILTPYSSSYGPFSNSEFLLENKVSSKQPLSSFNQLKSWEMLNSLNRKLLQKSDRVTMRQSIEARVPLLDLELVLHSASYGLGDCIKGKKGKIPLRSLLSRLNKTKLSSRKKQGFRTPADEWLRGELGNKVRCELLACEDVFRLVSKDRIEILFNEHNSRKREHASRILALYSLVVFWNKVSNNNKTCDL